MLQSPLFEHSDFTARRLSKTVLINLTPQTDVGGATVKCFSLIATWSSANRKEYAGKCVDEPQQKYKLRSEEQGKACYLQSSSYLTVNLWDCLDA